MGTNFYTDDTPERAAEGHTLHVGKRSNTGGSSMVFIWAIHAEEAQRRISEAGYVRDERGTVFTPREFFDEIIRSCATHNDAAIGKEFS